MVSHLENGNCNDNDKLHAGAPLQGTCPRSLAWQCPIEALGTRDIDRREGPSHVLDAAEATALESVLDRLNRLGIFAAEEAFPDARQATVPSCARHDVGGVQGGEDDRYDPLQALGDGRVRKPDQQPAGGARLLPEQVWEGRCVCCGDQGEQDGQECQDLGEW